MDFPATDDGVLTRSRLLSAGFGDVDIAKALRSGDWERLHTGAYGSTTVGAAEPDHYRRRVLAVATKAPEYVVCGVSAAAVLRVPLWDADLKDVHLYRPTRTGAGQFPGRRVHSALFEPWEVEQENGFRITSPARTLFDVARWSSAETAVVAGDWMLAQRLTSRQELLDLVSVHPALHGLSRLKRVVARLDSRSESPGESLSRLTLVRGGLPQPECQLEVFTASGQFVARCDFGYPDCAVVLEFDGRIKYQRNEMNNDRALEDVLFAEKRREDRLRAAGLVVVRIVWADLQRPDELCQRVQQALLMGRRAIDAGLVTARFVATPS